MPSPKYTTPVGAERSAGSGRGRTARARNGKCSRPEARPRARAMGPSRQGRHRALTVPGGTVPFTRVNSSPSPPRRASKQSRAKISRPRCARSRPEQASTRWRRVRAAATGARKRYRWGIPPASGGPRSRSRADRRALPWRPDAAPRPDRPGTIVNATFLIGVSGSPSSRHRRGRLLTASRGAIWGLLMAAFLTILTLGSVGIDDKYVQQDDPDQERAFEIAFTCQVVLGVVYFVLLRGDAAVRASVRPHRDDPPGHGLGAVIPALVLGCRSGCTIGGWTSCASAGSR